MVNRGQLAKPLGRQKVTTGGEEERKAERGGEHYTFPATRGAANTFPGGSQMHTRNKAATNEGQMQCDEEANDDGGGEEQAKNTSRDKQAEGT